MYKIILPKLVDQLIATGQDKMTGELCEVEGSIIRHAGLPGWARIGQTDGLTTAMAELNKPKGSVEIVRAALLRHLAELYTEKHIAKALKKLRNDAPVLRERLNAETKPQVGAIKLFRLPPLWSDKINIINNNKNMNESTIRRRAKTRGLKLEKSGTRNSQDPGYGKYRLIDPAKNLVVFGYDNNVFSATLMECAKYIHPETVDMSQPFDPKHHEAMLKLVEERFGHLDRLSSRMNPSDLRRHGTK